MLEPITLDRETRSRVEYGMSTEKIPASCAVEKPLYIESRKEVIGNMNKEIKRLTAKIAEFTDTKSLEYQKLEKRLAKCREIKKNCEFSIELMRKQMVVTKNK